MTVVAVLTSLALVLEIAGVLLFSWGEVRGPMAFVRYSGTGEGAASFNRDVNKLLLWRRLPLKLARRFGSRDVTAFAQEAIYESFPKKAWGLMLVVLGFVGQLVATIIGLFAQAR